MAIDKLGTNEDPDIKVQGSAVEVQPEVSRNEQIKEAAEILVAEEQVLIDQEIPQSPSLETDFNSNLVEFLSDDILDSISNDLLSAIQSDKQSRAEWEKTYKEGLDYLGMKFDESRSQPFEGSSGVIKSGQVTLYGVTTG